MATLTTHGAAPPVQAVVQSRERPIGIWLVCVALLVFAMVLLGGATRLTHSGLSIVEWQPLMGVLPPLDDAQWQDTFAKYQQFPEYQKINHGMTLPEFKRIFYFEYTHRLLGRTIGLAFAVPFVAFLLMGRISRRRLPVLIGLFALGGLQGLVGWWMVKSGLVDRPDVSHYRLTIHLGLAVAIFGALLWVACSFLFGPAQGRAAGLRWAAAGVLALAVVQILLGGLVAGLDAGFVYNSFPTMNGMWLPPELGTTTPVWHDMLENPVTVQFDHRIGAYVLTLAVLALCWALWRRRPGPQVRAAVIALAVVMVVQFALGVATLLLVVPVSLGVMHQGGALLLFATLVVLNHRLRGEGAR